MTARREWGRVRRLPSGSWQVRYPDLDGRLISAGTYPTKAEASAALDAAHTDQARGAWVDPNAGRVALSEYASQWLAGRSDLARSTHDLYSDLLRIHILPALGRIELSRLTTAAIRRWYLELRGRHESTAEKAYRLLRTLLNTAVADELIVKNPCMIKGAGVEHAAERPVATVPEIDALAKAMPERLRLLVLLAAWCGLRLGELRALRRSDLDELHGRVSVSRSRREARGGGAYEKAPKTSAGSRVVHWPPHLADCVADHLARFVGPEPEAYVFVGEKGRPLRPSTLQTAWAAARSAIGRPDLHLHDLRHTGNTLAAATGASTRELMARMGHANPIASLRYQHATEDRGAAIAKALSELALPAPVVPIEVATKDSGHAGGTRAELGPS